MRGRTIAFVVGLVAFGMIVAGAALWWGRMEVRGELARWRINPVPPNTVETLVPLMGNARRDARALDAEARAAFAAGDGEAAADAIVRGFALADQIDAHGVIVARLVGISIRALMLTTVHDLYGDGGVPPERVVDAVRAAGEPPALGEMMQAEADVLVSRWRSGKKVPGFVDALESFREVRDADAAGQPLRDLLAARGASGSGSGDPIEESIRVALRTLLQAQTRARLAATAIALRQHHAQYGEYPADLSALTPPAPDNPHTGLPFDYRLTETGFTLSAPGELRPELGEWEWAK